MRDIVLCLYVQTNFWPDSFIQSCNTSLTGAYLTLKFHGELRLGFSRHHSKPCSICSIMKLSDLCYLQSQCGAHLGFTWLNRHCWGITLVLQYWVYNSGFNETGKLFHNLRKKLWDDFYSFLQILLKFLLPIWVSVVSCLMVKYV